MKRILIISILLLFLSWCTKLTPEQIDAQAKLEAQHFYMSEAKRTAEHKRELEIINSTWYLIKKTFEAESKSSEDISYLKKSQQTRDVISIWVLWLGILWALTK